MCHHQIGRTQHGVVHRIHVAALTLCLCLCFLSLSFDSAPAAALSASDDFLCFFFLSLSLDLPDLEPFTSFEDPAPAAVLRASCLRRCS